MEIKEAREALLKIMDSIDKDKLSLYDLKTYAEILKIASEIQVKSFTEYMSEFTKTFDTNICCSKVATISDIKGGNE